MSKHQHFAGDLHAEPPLDPIAFSIASARQGTANQHEDQVLYQSILAYFKAARSDMRTVILADALDAGEFYKVPDKDMNRDVGLPMHECYHGPISAVFFRAGLLAARELLREHMVATFPDSKGIADEVSSWWPTEQIGDDPGAPRQNDFNELVDGGEDGPWTVKPHLSASVEALPAALRFVRRVRGIEGASEEPDDADEPGH